MAVFAVIDGYPEYRADKIVKLQGKRQILTGSASGFGVTVFLCPTRDIPEAVPV
jgi:hypothetical protein